MLYIVIYHLIIHVPEVYEQTSWGRPLRTLCHIGVIVFVMISGYYGIRRKWSGLVKIALSVSFYNLLGLMLAMAFAGHAVDRKDLLSVFLPITNGGYWFITSYLVLYLIAPYVNIVFEKIERREFHVFLVILLAVVCYGGGIMDVEIGNGRGIMAFVLSYSIGYYIHKYYPQGYAFPFIGNRPVLVYSCCFLVLFACIAFLPTLLSKLVNFICFGYNEIGLYAMAVLFLLMFQSLSFKNRFVNWSAASALGIYLIHGNKYVSSLFVYPTYKVIFDSIPDQWLLLAVHLLFAVVIIMICVFTDKLRQFLFSLVERRC